MSSNPMGRRALALSIIALLALTLASAPAWAGDKTAPGSKQFGEVKVVGPTKGQGSLSVPSKVQGLPPAGMLKSKAALPTAPKHYKLDPDAGALRFGDGQHGSRPPTGQGTSPKYKAGQGAMGALPAPPVKGPEALGSMPLPPPKGQATFPKDPDVVKPPGASSPRAKVKGLKEKVHFPLVPEAEKSIGGASERGIIVQKVPEPSQAGDTVPMEEMSLNYDKVEENYTPQSSSGKSKGNVETTWKVEEGEK